MHSSDANAINPGSMWDLVDNSPIGQLFSHLHSWATLGYVRVEVSSENVVDTDRELAQAVHVVDASADLEEVRALPGLVGRLEEFVTQATTPVLQVGDAVVSATAVVPQTFLFHFRRLALGVETSHLQFTLRTLSRRAANTRPTTIAALALAATGVCYYLVPWTLVKDALIAFGTGMTMFSIPGPILVVIVVVFLGLISPYVSATMYMLVTRADRVDFNNVPSTMLKGVGRELRALTSEDRPSASHPKTSAMRNCAVEHLLAICTRIGHEPYFHLQSRRIMEMTAEMGFTGSTYSLDGCAWTHNDPYVMMEYSDVPDSDQVIVMVDRDYHVDMNRVLSLGLPVLLYTFEPVKPCDSDGEMFYSFDASGRLVGGVPGAEPWEHCLWDYPDDKVTVCANGVANHYKVMKWRYTATGPKVIVLLYPIASNLDMEERGLTRYNPVSGGSIVIRSRDLTRYSTVGSSSYGHIATSIWDELYAQVAARSLVTALPAISQAAISQRLTQLGVEDDTRDLAAGLWATLKLIDTNAPPRCMSTRFAFVIGDNTHEPPTLHIDRDARPYRTDDTDEINGETLPPQCPQLDLRPLKGVANVVKPVFIDELPAPPQVNSIDSRGDGMADDLTHGATTLATPIVHGGSFPAKSVQNALQAVEWRLIVPSERAAEAVETIPDVMFTYIDEFLTLLAAGAVDRGVCIPLTPQDEEYVATQQDRPAQRAAQFEAASQPLGSTKGSDMFPKLEHGAVSSTSDSRNIVTEQGHFKTELAGYTYPITEVLKAQEWYAFGQSCASVADRVAKLCQLATNTQLSVALTDYNRFDGTVNAFVRYFVQCMYLRLYPEAEHDRIKAMLDRRMNVKVTFKLKDTQAHLGVLFRYLSGFSLLSGDGNTSVIGSAFNAFVAYATHRESGESCQNAWDLLGIYGGDDGLTILGDVGAYRVVAKSLGVDLDASEYSVDRFDATDPSTYICFLSRVYGPDVWFGDSDSCCSFLRTATKLTYATNVESKVMRLVEKCQSLLINDRATPGLSTYAKAVMTIYQDVTGEAGTDLTTLNQLKHKGLNWWACHALTHGGSFPCANGGGWMEDYIQADCPGFDLANFEADVAGALAQSAVANGVFRDVWKQHTSKRRRKEILTSAFAFIAAVHTDVEVKPKVKPGQVEVVTQLGDQELLENHDAPNKVPVVEDIDSGKVTLEPRVDLGRFRTIELQGEYIINETTPFPSLQPGSRKCVLVNTHLVVQLPALKLKSVTVIYSGAYNPITMPVFIASIKAVLPRVWRIYLIDPLFTKHPYWTKPGSRVVVQAMPITKHTVANILKANDRGGDVIWFDDSSVGEDNYRQTWNNKMGILNQMGDRLKACTIKLRYMTGPLSIDQLPGMVYQTTKDYPDLINPVNELRYEYVAGTKETIDPDATYEAMQDLHRMDLTDTLSLLSQAEGYGVDECLVPGQWKRPGDTKDKPPVKAPVLAAEPKAKRTPTQRSKTGADHLRARAKLVRTPPPPTDQPQKKPKTAVYRRGGAGRGGTRGRGRGNTS
jgi:hypothetical protein